MRIQLKGFTNNNSDAIVVIECECGNKWMLDEAGEFKSNEMFVYWHGVPTKNLRCSPSTDESLKRMANGQPRCRERYRIILDNDNNVSAIKVLHIAPRPREEVLETSNIKFPPKEVGTGAPVNPPPSTEYVTSPY